MKTLKLSALALSIVFVGSVVAMETGPEVKLQVEALLARVIPHQDLLTQEQQDAWNEANNRINTLGDTHTLEDVQALRTMLQGYEKEIKIKQSRLTAKPRKAVALDDQQAANFQQIFDETLPAPKGESLLTKLKALPANALHQITSHPWVSVGGAVVVVLGVVIYTVNKKAAQDAEVRNNDDEDDADADHIVA